MNTIVNLKGRWTSSTTPPESIADTPLRDLFWNVPATSTLFDEAEQRVSAVLCSIPMPEPVQLFDDLYEDLAC